MKRSELNEINEELIELTNHLLKRFTSFLYKNNNVLNKDLLVKDLLSKKEIDSVPKIHRKYQG